MNINSIFKQINDSASEAHLAHLNTSSYAEHMALGEFYENVREKMDALIETMVSLGASKTSPPAQVMVLQTQYNSLRKMRDDVTEDNAALEVVFDDVLLCYTKALYKLKLK